MNHSEIVSFLWGVADLIRDTFKRGKYQDVILPLTVLRRLDCVLEGTKGKVLKRQAELRGKGLQDLDAQLRKASGFAFYNTSKYDFKKLLGEAPAIAKNLRNYIAGFSPNMREVLERFDFDNAITKLDEAGLLFKVVERFKNVDLHPDKIDNPTMGTIFEECSQEFVAESEYAEIMKRGLPRIGDILFTTEAPLGNVALVDREGIALAHRIIRFRMNPHYFDSKFVLFAMMSSYFQAQLAQLSTGSTAEGLKASKLPNVANCVSSN